MSTYSTNLKIELIGTGEQVGTWGTTTNTNLGTALEESIVGYSTVTINDNNSPGTTLTLSDSNASQTARNYYLRLTGALTDNRELTVPTLRKTYVVENSTTGGVSGYNVTVKTATGSSVVVPNGKKVLLYVLSTGVVEQINYFSSLTVNSMALTGTPTAPNAAAGTNTDQIATTAFVNTEITKDTQGAPNSVVVYNSSGTINNGAVFTCTAASPAVLTFTGYTPVNNDVVYLYTTNTLPAGLSLATPYYVVNAAGATSQLSLTQGGTGVNTTTTGTGTHTAALERLLPAGALVGTTATQTLTNKTLTSPTINGGTITTLGTALAVDSGGTGATTLAANNVLLGNGTSALQTVAPSTSGNILSSNGTTWISAAPLTLGTALTTPAGSTLEFTGIPAWVKRITVIFDVLSQNAGGDPFRVQLGTSAGYGSPTYASISMDDGGNTTVGDGTVGFIIKNTSQSSDALTGTMTICNISGNKWVSSHSGMSDGSDRGVVGGGVVTLSGALDRLRVNTMTANTFDAGSVNVIYE